MFSAEDESPTPTRNVDIDADSSGNWHARIASPWSEEHNAVYKSDSALPVPHHLNDFDENNYDKLDEAKCLLGHHRRQKHNSWFGQIDSPWLTQFDIDVSDVDADGGDAGSTTTTAAAPSPSPNLLAVGIAITPGSDSVKKKKNDAAAPSPWVSRFHITVEGADHPAYIPAPTYKSCHEVSHLHPVNQFDHLERGDITHLNSLGAARRKKHPWHPHIESNWLDDHSDDEEMIADWKSRFQPVNEFDPNLDVPDAQHEVHDLSLGAHRKRKHGSWHPTVEAGWMSAAEDVDGDAGDELDAFAVAHPINTHEPHDTDARPEDVDNHHLSLGAHRVEKHRWHPHVASGWLKEDSYPHPINDFTVFAGHGNALHPVHDMTLGGVRSKRHKSWRPIIDSPWLSDTDPQHVQEYDINLISPWLVDLEVYVQGRL